jgi:hypothetical protein
LLVGLLFGGQVRYGVTYQIVAYNDGWYLRVISGRTPIEIGTEIEIEITYHFQHALHTCHKKQLRRATALEILS